MTYGELKAMLDRDGVREDDEIVFLARGKTELTRVVSVKIDQSSGEYYNRHVSGAIVQLAPAS